jgi:hypothetical protein
MAFRAGLKSSSIPRATQHPPRLARSAGLQTGINIEGALANKPLG